MSDVLDCILTRYSVAIEPLIRLPYSRINEYPALMASLGFRRGVEVGVLKGLFCETLCRIVPGLHMTGIDAWANYPGYNDYTPDEIDAAYQEAKTRAEKSGFDLIRAMSMDAALRLDDNSLDFVFIDAGHDFQSIANDVSVWSRKVRPGGIVSGHDYVLERLRGWAVRPVIDAWCEVMQIAPLFIWTKDKYPTWMYVKGNE